MYFEMVSGFIVGFYQLFRLDFKPAGRHPGGVFYSAKRFSQNAKPEPFGAATDIGRAGRYCLGLATAAQRLGNGTGRRRSLIWNRYACSTFSCCWARYIEVQGALSCRPGP